MPHCRPDQVQVYGVARYETVRISCEVNIDIAIIIKNAWYYLSEVVSNPSSGLRFHWVFNTSGETMQMENTGVKVDGTRSMVDYTPRSILFMNQMILRSLRLFDVYKTLLHE